MRAYLFFSLFFTNVVFSGIIDRAVYLMVFSWYSTGPTKREPPMIWIGWILKDAEGQATDCIYIAAPAPGRFVYFRIAGVVVYLSLLQSVSWGAHG